MIQKIKLTPSQQQTFNYIKKYIYTPNNNQIQLITGAAGTGKTFLVSEIIKACIKTFRFKIGISAPTNKATNVLYHNLKGVNNLLHVGTIHNLFGLVQDIDSYGNIKFIRQNTDGWKKLNKIRILFVDEASMLDDMLFKYLLKEQMNNNLKIILIGDPYQIPPVNAEFSPPLLKTNIEKYCIKHHKLTEVVRQKKDSNIIKISNHIKENIESEIITFDKFNDLPDIEFLHKNDLGKHIQIIEKYFLSNEFKKDANHIKIAAWTNNIVNKYNDIIRYIIYQKDNLPKLMKNEQIILDSPIFEIKKIRGKTYKKKILDTNDELEIVNYTIENDTPEIFFDNNNQFKCYKAMACKKELNGNRTYYELKIVHEDSQQKFNEILTLLENVAKNEPKGNVNAKYAWINYYDFKDYYLQYKYNYTITTHKSQGSTFHNTIVIFSDIMQNTDILERNRILYTALTRPKNKLYIIE